ncbi:hypothetical protein CCACVL1_04158 [Corchorus capsularis]|uniref:Uncharacterized protein n=1 Tax=Corchorus capsularis TaxID=210143 RepID=A0A1R3JUN9_COCAP|nr:hypothetical protein CCACVL1_04158 [Corchorus capsularis]
MAVPLTLTPALTQIAAVEAISLSTTEEAN